MKQLSSLYAKQTPHLKALLTGFILIFLIGTKGWGQVTLPHYDPIDYTAGQMLKTQSDWAETVTTGGDSILISSGNLVYTGLPASTGNKVTFNGAGNDVEKFLTVQNTGTVYYSFLMNVSQLGSLNTTGSYFTGLMNPLTAYCATLWARNDGSGGYNLGINLRAASENTVWSGAQAVNNTLFIVISYKLVAGANNNTVNLWINPTPGLTEPPATLSSTNSVLGDVNNVAKIFIKQSSLATTPFIEMDELRIGKSWADVNPAPPAAYAVTGTGSYCSGGTGLPVGLAGSETGVTYTLYKDAVAQTPTVAGTGSAISFGNQTAGTYTVSGTNTAGTTEMTGNAIITMVAAPTANAGFDLFVTRNIGYTISGASAANYSSVSWAKTGGIANGILTNANTLTPVFEGTSDGPAVLTLSVTGCGSTVTDQVTLYVVSADPVTWYGAIDNDWHKAGNWFPQFVPLAGYNVLIPSGLTHYPTIAAAAECDNIIVQSGASLIDNSLLTLAAGGKIKVEHPAVAYGRWHFVSSPVSGLQSGFFAGHYLRSFTPADGYVPILTATVPLTAMQGFALWPKATNDFTAPFIGGLNKAASYNFTISGAGTDLNERFNLVGNPYPSSISWDAAGWTKTGVNNAIYVRDASNWFTYIDGVGVPSGFGPLIAPTQGFFVRASTSGGGSLVMTNAVRVHNNTAFHKKSGDAVPNLVRLKVSGNGYSDEAVVRFTPEATAEFDGVYDAEKLFGDVAKAAQIYTLGSTPLAINSLPEQSIVPVCIKTGTNGSYTIAATQINDLHYVTLEDAETGIFTDLSVNPYTFDAVAGTSDQRFKLHFSLLSVEETPKTEAAIYSYQQTVHINLKDQEKGDIFIYNITGQLVASKLAVQGMKEIRLQNTGNYIVKVITKNSTVVRKVFIQ